MNKFVKILRGVSLLLILACVVVSAASCDLVEQYIPGLGGHQHNLTKVAKVEATCTEAGCETYYTCDGCEKIFKDFGATMELDAPVVIEATGHSIVGILGKEPSCTEAGVENCYTCTECKALFSDLKGENPIDAPATIPSVSHDLVKTEAKAATCTEAGSIEFYTCKVCKAIFSDADGKNAINVEDTVVAATGHALTATEAKEATCTEAGNIAYWTCGNCNEVYANAEATEVAEDVVIPAKGHDYGDTLVVEGATTTYEPGASFTTEGLTVKKVCACGDVVTVTGYTYDKTGALTPEDSSVVITYVEGEKTYTATISITVVHVHVTGELIAKVEPTCTETGTLAHYDCTICKKHFEDADATKELTDLTIAAKGHSGVKTEEVKPTCTTGGNSEYWTCSDCGLYFADEECTSEITLDSTILPPAEHSLAIESDENHHWNYCVDCGYTTEKENHSGVAYPFEGPTCEACGRKYGEPGWDGWVHFAPGVVWSDYYEGIEGTIDGTANIDYELITLENGMNATKFIVKAGTLANSSVAVWNDQNLAHNIKIPVRQNGTKAIVYITNHGTEDITVTVGQVNSAKDTGSGTVLVPAGQTAYVPFVVSEGAAQGNNSWFAVRDDVTADTSFSVWGYFHVGDDINELGIKTPANTLTYKVGDTFSSEGIRLQILSTIEGAKANYSESEIYYNFTTDFDGKTFTAADIGSHTVTVSFGGATATYAIVVEDDAHVHNIVHVPYQAPTCTVNGHEAYYVCNVDGCGQLFADAEGNTPISSITVLEAGHVESAAIPGHKANCSRCGEEYGDVLPADGWVHFAPGVVWSDYYEAISGTVNGADYIDYELITLENGMNATKFTFAAGTPANASTAFWNDQDLAHNIKVPVRTEGTRTIVVITNHGTEDLTFTFGQVNSAQDTGSGTVLVPAGKTAAVEFTITSGADTGNNGWIAVRNAVNTETSITLYGFFNVEGDVEGLNIKAPANKLVFAAGEVFTAEGLRLNMTNSHGGGAYYGQTEIYSNFTTDLDGHVFTAEDEGKKTVTVSFCGKTVTYEIEVAGHQHEIVLVEGRDAVKCEKDGYEAYYRCTVAGCDSLFADADAQTKIDGPVAISAHGSATIANGKVVCADCLTYDLGENWVFYNITTNYGANSVVNGKIEAADIDGVPGTMIYIGAGTVGGQGANFQLCMSSNDADRQTVIPNLGANHISGELRHVLVFYKNYGTEDVTLNLQNDASGGNGSITIPAGGTAVSAFDIRNVNGSNWFNLFIDSNVNVDTQIGAYGYIYINDSEVELHGIKKAANKTEFAVGETFSAAGLVLDANIPSSNTMWLYASTGYTTNLDGKVFTEAGTYTVEVYFCGKSLTYEITVA